MSENRRELSACRCWWWSDISPLAPVLHIQAAGLWVSIVRYLLKSAPISGVPCRMCCCCLLPGFFCSVVWLDQVLSPILLLPGAASRVQTVTTRPFLVWVLLSCLRPITGSFRSGSQCPALDYYPGLTLAHLCSFCLCRLEEGHTTQRTLRNIRRSSSKHSCFYLSFGYHLFPLGRQSDFFLFPSHSCQPAGPVFFFLLLSGDDFYSAYSLFFWRP